MTYEQIIIAIQNAAPQLSDASLRLLLQLIALSIEYQSPVLQASHRSLAQRAGLSKEGVAIAIRGLPQTIRVVKSPTGVTTFILPDDWIPAQRSLTGGVGGDVRTRGNPVDVPPTRAANQDSASRKPGQKVSHKPGQGGGNQDSLPGQYGANTVDNCLKFPTSQDGSDSSPIRNAHARVDRSIEQGSADPGHSSRIDRAVRTVKILPHQQQAAAIFRSRVQEYRDAFPNAPRASWQPDETVTARCLAIAHVEELCSSLCELASEGVPPGYNDMWFFFTLLNKIHGIDRALIAERISAQRSKAPSNNPTPSLWTDELVDTASAAMRRMA